MMRRKGEWLVALFGAAFLVLLGISFRPGRRPSSGSARKESMPDVSSDAGQATTVLKGFDYTETVKGKPLFHIQSERTVGYGPAAGLLPNLYALEKVTLTLYPETGAPVTVNAERATYDHRTNEAHLQGNVRWLDGKGALGETEKMDFQPSTKQLVAPSAVRLTKGTFALTARSGVYDLPSREARLAGPVRGAGTGEGTGGLSSLAADSAVYRRDENLVELSGSVSGGSSDGNLVQADRLVLKTEAETNRLDWARAEGHVRGRIAAGSLPVPAAAGTGPAGRGAAGKGAARPPQQYSGDRAGLLFSPDGSVRSLSLSGAPAAIDEPARKVRASTIEVTLESGRARTAKADGNVRIDSEGSRAEAEHATMAISPAGEMETAELTGSVRMTGENRTASADRAVEVASRGVWILTANAGGAGGGSATAEGEGSKISASRIEIDEKRKGLRAEGAVRATLTPREAGRGAASPVGDSSKPTFGKADRMTVDDASKVATLSGNATLWQGASSVNGNDITLNDAERTLVAVGNTRTVFAPAPAPGAAPAGKERERHPSVVTARRVIYRESAKAEPAKAKEAGAASPATALFEGSVAMTSADWRATANEATAFIGADRQLDRVVLAGDVSLLDTRAGRTGRAERATDLPREGKTILEGSPASVVDREGNRVAGATLTISKRGGSVEVTAPEGGRTETIHKTTAKS
ncbi:MAG TPA: LPS export ABC transporter periplasmic protein LptC [Thermoanaerobaculia bacterium]|nr:LPS export ABC transporter periplasmic protein LptC [Thermoanaerobaculia bacterium]